MGRQRSQQSGPTACRAEHVRWEQRTSTEARNQESQLHSEFHPANRTQHYTRAEPLSRASTREIPIPPVFWDERGKNTSLPLRRVAEITSLRSSLTLLPA